MNPEWLLQHFNRISEAPDAVPRLRRFILDLAVRGKLVEQDPSDEPAADLLKNIQLQLEEIPFELPAKWVSVKAARLLTIQYGKALPASDRLTEGRVPVYGSNGVVGYCETALTEDPAIIIGRKGSAGALNLCESPSWTTDVAYYLIPPIFFDIHFLFIVLQTLDLESLGKGVKPGLSRSEAYQLPIVVPPFAEQHRIVAKVDELMALCDELEASQTKRENRRDRLVAATLQGLSNGDGNGESGNHVTFDASARFYFSNLSRLTTHPEHIQQLRQTILNLAVRGKLVPQDQNDEPASALIERIRQERFATIKESKIQSEHKLNGRGKASAPFALPHGWSWTRFPDLGTFGRGKSKHRPRNDASLFEGGTHLFVQTGDVARSKGIIETFTGKYNDIGLAQSTKWPKGTLCITIAANIADSGILSFDACFPDSVVGFIPAPIFPNARYFEYFIRTVKAGLLEYAPATAQKNINIGILNEVLIPLPPLAEQHRIIAKVDELMALCDELESQITSTTATRHQFLEASLHEALSA
ncbi:MAG: restriction endonuclease subunit S [Syntrophales bacterium]